MLPLSSLTIASKILKPGRRVVRSAVCTISPGDRRLDAGLYRGDRLQPAAVFVPQRETEQQVFDGVQTDAGQVGGTPGADAFEKLKRRGEDVVTHGRRHFTALRL